MPITDASNSGLPSHRVDVVEPGRSARRHWTRCEIGQNLHFDTVGLQAYCFANWDPRVYDAFLLAAAVQFAITRRHAPLPAGAERSSSACPFMSLRIGAQRGYPKRSTARWSSLRAIGGISNSSQDTTHNLIPRRGTLLFLMVRAQ